MRRMVLLVGVVAVVVSACGSQDGSTASSGQAGHDEAAGEAVEADAGGEPQVPEEPEDPFTDFDRDEAAEIARTHLGVPEDEIETDRMIRVIRRGDEELPVTADLIPGRLNLELDDEGAGFVVTRVVVETPDGDDLVVE